MKAEIIFWSYFSFWYSQNRSRISGPSGCCEVANLLVYLSPFASSSAHPHWHCWEHVDCIYNLHGHMLPPHFLILFVEWKFYGKHFCYRVVNVLRKIHVAHHDSSFPIIATCTRLLIWSAFFSICPYTSLFAIITHEDNCCYTCIYLYGGTFD